MRVDNTRESTFSRAGCRGVQRGEDLIFASVKTHASGGTNRKKLRKISLLLLFMQSRLRTRRRIREKEREMTDREKSRFLTFHYYAELRDIKSAKSLSTSLKIEPNR